MIEWSYKTHFGRAFVKLGEKQRERQRERRRRRGGGGGVREWEKKEGEEEFPLFLFF